ncbi:MAG: hypothetical protein ACYTFX_08635 [Planctomycetota bacterium]|jgi:hypothetical protein
MTTLVTRNSETAAFVPSAGVLERGELAVNLPDRKLYTKDHTDTVVLISEPETGEANTSSSPGTGEALTMAKSGADLPFKVLKEGTNVTLTGDADSVTIAAAAVGETLPTGTTVSGTLRWNGSAWVEETQCRIDASGNIFPVGQVDGVDVAQTRSDLDQAQFDIIANTNSIDSNTTAIGTKLDATGTAVNSTEWGDYKISVDAGTPSGTDPGTIYFVT